MSVGKGSVIICLLCAGMLLACQRNHPQHATSDSAPPQARQATAAERPSAPPRLPQEFIKAHRGAINRDLPIVMLLKRNADELTGNYIYGGAATTSRSPAVSAHRAACGLKSQS